jgi:hypothetical protein
MESIKPIKKILRAVMKQDHLTLSHIPEAMHSGDYKEMSSILPTNNVLVFEPKCGGRGELRGLSQ